MTDAEREYALVATFKEFLDKIQSEVDRMSKKYKQEYQLEFDKPKVEWRQGGSKVVLAAKITKKKVFP